MWKNAKCQVSVLHFQTDFWVFCLNFFKGNLALSQSTPFSDWLKLTEQYENKPNSFKLSVKYNPSVYPPFSFFFSVEPSSCSLTNSLYTSCKNYVLTSCTTYSYNNLWPRQFLIYSVLQHVELFSWFNPSWLLSSTQPLAAFSVGWGRESEL